MRNINLFQYLAAFVSIVLAIDADTAFEFMASGMNQTYWALGSWARVDEGDGVVSGTSLWDGSKLYIRIEAEPKLRLVDYYTKLFGEPTMAIMSLSRRISTRAT